MKRTLAAAAIACGAVFSASAAQPDITSALQWRQIGPFRGGWSTTAVGIPDRPDTFYFGAAGGGVWKTDDAGATWRSIGDNLPAASVGAMAIATKRFPHTIYVGTGQVEARYDVAAGNGVYKSVTDGKTWEPLGLTQTRHIGAILVDTRSDDTVLVGALGHYFGPNKERGVYKSTDGGKTWKQTLFIDENTGVVDLAADPQNPDVIYAAAWQARNWPWLSYFQPNAGPGSGVYKSTDGGNSWKRLGGNGWPTGDLGRIGLATANDGYVYAVVNAAPHSGNVPHAASKTEGGLYRSADGGTTWTRTSDESWLQNDYFARITIADPRVHDLIYSAGQSIRESGDGGKTWNIVKGAPGGDDYHSIWFNPKHLDHSVVASDQGTAVSVDGLVSWSDWYNQPTGQFYHLAADNRFPYWVYSGQQDSGTIGASSRSDYGALSFRDWNPVGGDERDYDIPDPQDANIVYGSGLGGRLSRWDKRTGEVQNIAPWPTSASYGGRPTEFKYRYTWITPIAVSQKAPYPLYQGAQVLFRSLDRGNTWSVISPDLSAKDPNAKNCSGDLAPAQARACGYGVIFSIALSPRDNDEIWIGTDDGVIQRTRDGGTHWDNVTPAVLPAWGKVSSLDVAATTPDTAYAAIDNHRQDDFRPRVLRTHDGGKTWNDISTGLPAGEFVAVVRADPVKSGLLYAGTQSSVFVSFDDGAHWQSLRSNLPTATVNDLLVHDNDLIAATQGRAIWVLDDVTSLRQHDRVAQSATLFEPAAAVRVRGSQNKDTPPPADTALGDNPPAGAIIDYWLPEKARNVVLEIRQGANVVRRYASGEKDDTPDADRYFAAGWAKPPAPLSADAGSHRFVWNLRTTRPRAVHFDFGINAVYREGTPTGPQGMLVATGEYDVVLSVDGKSAQTKLRVTADPRVTIDAQGLQSTQGFGRDVYAALDRDFVGFAELHAVNAQIGKIEKNVPPEELHAAIDKFKSATAPLTSGEGDSNENLDSIGEILSGIANDVEGSDRAPTQPQHDLLAATNQRLERALSRWNGIKQGELAQLNAALQAASKPPIEIPPADKLTLQDAPEGKDLP